MNCNHVCILCTVILPDLDLTVHHHIETVSLVILVKNRSPWLKDSLSAVLHDIPDVSIAQIAEKGYATEKSEIPFCFHLSTPCTYT